MGGVNYLLGVTNSSFVAVLETYMSLDTPVPFYMLLATNISWGQLLPEGGEMMSINRPLFMAGQAGSLTGVDFGSRVNQVALTGQWSNVTFDELVLENMGLGNRWAMRSSSCAQVVFISGAAEVSFCQQAYQMELARTAVAAVALHTQAASATAAAAVELHTRAARGTAAAALLLHTRAASDTAPAAVVLHTQLALELHIILCANANCPGQICCILPFCA